MRNAHAEILAGEQRLRLAMLAGNVSELEVLLSDRLVFINQDGRRLSKADDLAAHRSGSLSLGRIDVEGEPNIVVLGETALVWVTASLAGAYAGQAFAGTFAYSRVWHWEHSAWSIVAAHCSAVVADMKA